MRNFVVALIYISAFMLVAACSPESTPLVSEPVLVDSTVEVPKYEQVASQSFEWVTEDGGQSQLDFNPQLDILFVTDNSDSMRSAQANLVRNIDRFTAGIVKNRVIDYHVGVISVWENSERYLKAKKDSYEIGDLRFVKDASGQSFNRRYVTKQDGAGRAILASTLNIGVTPFAQGGPEFEEMFSPLAAALEKTGRGATNEGFFRDDAHLVVIFLSDADDSSKDILPEEMAQKLIDFKKGRENKISAYGVLVRPQDPDSVKDWDLRVHPKYHPECFDMAAKPPKNNGTCKDGFGPKRIEELIVNVNRNSGTPDQIRAKHIMSIVSPKFGDDLAKIGDEITVKTLAKTIFLSQRPRVNSNDQIMLRVRYGNQVIPQKAAGGWLYNPEDNSVQLSGDVDYDYKDGARFSVDLVPLTVKR